MPYDRDGLTEAVGASRTLTEVLATLGRRQTPGARAYCLKLTRQWGIDTTHLAREGVRHTEARLREAVTASTNLREAVRRLGLAPVGGNQAHIGRRIAQLGIDISHFAQPLRRGRNRGPRRDLLVLGSREAGRTPAHRLKRALLATGANERCWTCGTDPVWCGAPLRLEVDHVNGDWWDNRPENLRLLCPNCHATTDTYRGRRREETA